MSNERLQRYLSSIFFGLVLLGLGDLWALASSAGSAPHAGEALEEASEEGPKCSASRCCRSLTREPMEGGQLETAARRFNFMQSNNCGTVEMVCAYAPPSV